ncbi:zinc dependent phospholipase C family protein [Candidatus Formimonas warabiya]|nr:zinc dependent phospholipase C family protein [Candidatus Formimonas warabiya]
MLQKVAGSVESISKHLLVVGRVSSPVELGLCSTHVMCTIQARRILAADGYTVMARLLEAHGNDLDLGVCWPDSDLGGLGCVHHFYHGKTGIGLLGRTPADVFCRRYFLRAVKYWRQGNYKKAMFFLGAASHFIQDICEPHHANCYIGMGHRRYEDWAAEHRNEYTVQSEGIYRSYQEPDRCLREWARKSYELLDLVTEKSSIYHYRQATEYLLPLTQRITAGFFYNFFRQVGMDIPHPGDLEVLRVG